MSVGERTKVSHSLVCVPQGTTGLLPGSHITPNGDCFSLPDFPVFRGYIRPLRRPGYGSDVRVDGGIG